MSTDEKPSGDEPTTDALPMLDPQALRDVDGRSTVRRELFPVPELDGSLCVWGLSCEDRLLVEQLTAQAGDDQGARTQARVAAWISMAVRESLDDGALQIWRGDVKPEDAKKILAFDATIIDRVMDKSIELTGEPQQQEELLGRIRDFMREAEGETHSCLARLCSVSAASEGCQARSSDECPLRNSPTLWVSTEPSETSSTDGSASPVRSD